MSAFLLMHFCRTSGKTQGAKKENKKEEETVHSLDKQNKIKQRLLQILCIHTRSRRERKGAKRKSLNAFYFKQRASAVSSSLELYCLKNCAKNWTWPLLHSLNKPLKLISKRRPGSKTDGKCRAVPSGACLSSEQQQQRSCSASVLSF